MKLLEANLANSSIIGIPPTTKPTTNVSGQFLFSELKVKCELMKLQLQNLQGDSEDLLDTNSSLNQIIVGEISQLQTIANVPQLTGLKVTDSHQVSQNLNGLPRELLIPQKGKQGSEVDSKLKQNNNIIAVPSQQSFPLINTGGSGIKILSSNETSKTTLTISSASVSLNQANKSVTKAKR